MSIGSKIYTVTEFEQFLADKQNRLLELVNGEIVEKMPTEEHGIIAAWIATFLNLYLMDHHLKGWVAVEARHKIEDDEHNSRLPDVSLILGSRVPVTKGSVPQMPDLAVEIKSPDDTYKGMREEADYYLAHGCQMVWLIYPEKEFVEVYRPDADIQILSREDILEGGNLLPGFVVPVSKVFPRE